MDIHLTLQQKQSLSQAQIQSLGILSLDAIGLNQFLRDEYLENPLLDYTEKIPDILTYETIKPLKETYGSTADKTRKTPDIPRSEEHSVQQYLLQQLTVRQYQKSEWALIKYLIDCLDDNGFFRFSPEEIAEQTGTDPETISRCLADLRSLEPAGIFSSSLTDCLIRQLDEENDGYEYMKLMISEHMEDMAAGRISSISRALDLSTAAVRKYMDRIRLLNPKPLSGLLPAEENYIIPDIMYTYQDGEWTISLNDNWIQNYHLNDYYMKMLKTATDPELVSYFEGKLSHVQFIFSCIEQRRNTLLTIAKEILHWQEDFFLMRGKLSPMTMHALAEKLGIHPSTLSRALKGKYIQYPKGSILCKDLFRTAAVTMEDNEAVSQTDVKSLIKEFIDSENKAKPYSDQALVKLLKSKNITISRRAVTKYRQELGIGSSMDRKE